MRCSEDIFSQTVTLLSNNTRRRERISTFSELNPVIFFQKHFQQVTDEPDKPETSEPADSTQVEPTSGPDNDDVKPDENH